MYFNPDHESWFLTVEFFKNYDYWIWTNEKFLYNWELLFFALIHFVRPKRRACKGNNIWIYDTCTFALILIYVIVCHVIIYVPLGHALIALISLV